MLYINDDLYALSASELEQEIRLLPAWRRDIVLRYTHELGRRQGLLAYQLLCQGLRKDFGIEGFPRFAYGEHGKPYLADYPALHFNLSHCKTAVACAISTNPVGVDIETFRPVRESVVRYAMSEAEAQRILQAARPERAFTILWTQKEALVKLTGEGLNRELPALLESNTHRLSTLVMPQYVCTLAED